MTEAASPSCMFEQIDLQPGIEQREQAQPASTTSSRRDSRHRLPASESPSPDQIADSAWPAPSSTQNGTHGIAARLTMRKFFH
jgi:hypothetical protein